MLALAVLVYTPLAAQEKAPLRDRIDRLVESASVGPPSAVADDATFLRRVTLDLSGRIPTSREARAFLGDAAPDKRAKAVDRLLASPEHVRHMAVTFDVWLMERRADKHVKTDEWRAFLAGFFRANKPYTELAREILGADGADPSRRAPARFSLDRDVAPDALTRDVARMFFGMDLQCAQCHDHPRINDYLQRDYYGIYAFLNRASLFQPDPKKPAVILEKPDGDVSFKSVFTKAEGNTRPRMPDGIEIDEPSFAKGEEYQVKPDPKDKNLRPVPKFSRRAELARLTGEGASRAFNRNIVNRLWAQLMGRGLVEPLDLHHSDNPPSHPELLEMLASDFAAMKHDLRAFLRELALTRTYQRSIEMPATLAAQSAAAAARVAPLEADAEKRSRAAATAEELFQKAAKDLEAARKAATGVAAELGKADAAIAQAKKASDAAAAVRDAAQKELAGRQDLLRTVTEAAQKASQAATRLAGDPELAAAAATFQARAEKLGAEASAAAKAAADKTAAATAASAAYAAAEKAAGDVRGRLGDANAGIKKLAVAFIDADGRVKLAKVEASTAKRRAEDTKVLSEYGRLHAAAAASREAHQRVRSELAAARDAVAKMPVELPAREARLAEARKSREAAVAARDAAQKDLAAREDALRAVADAAGTAEEVALKASKDAELVAAAAKVKAKKERLAAEVAELKKAAAQREEACRRSADELAAAERARADLAGAKERIPLLESQLKPAAEKAAADQGRSEEAFVRLTATWTSGFAVASLDPLTPEQICWSMMQATGVIDLQRAAAEAEFAKKSPPAPEAERPDFVYTFLTAKLAGNEAPFVKIFGGGPGQPQDDFYATVDQALFLENGGLVRGWLAPAKGNLTDRLMKLEDPQELAQELYLSAFTRPPSDREAAEVAKYLAARKDARLQAIQELVWATLTSVEFRFKH